ncbi:hypothetical protein CONLIGDRAFT_683509 [Coniochaeta ligniaria NRRL 30616]|uniref:Uncharacterized protein n=1 Tax=Coniochaeta ligniaria NRRL 30616 TaxID=1408157 RepID=A0A1J7J9S2_9PEZI|nr:hypothetical protein CONLIGDRAFT_683509 [Coniochaeta ligniaria NRRL 30616]
MTDGQSPDSGDAVVRSPWGFLTDVQLQTMDAREDHWAKDIPFRDHFTRLAPTGPVSEADTEGKNAKTTFKRTREPHFPMFLAQFEHTHSDGSTETLEGSTLRRPPPHCRCHSCIGTRLQSFYQDLVVWATQIHFENCIQQGTPCNIFCPGQPTSVTNPACLTPEHLEFAEQQGWNVKAVLTGVGFPYEYRPPMCSSYDPALGIKDVGTMLKRYSFLLHGSWCTPTTPCRPWCFKRADQITAADIKNAKEVFPDWQRRMLASEGMALALRNNKLEKKDKKKRKKKKMASLSKAENQWSEAPFELSAFLGVFPRLHKPTCCPEFPCVSQCFCFPEEAASSRSA